MAGRRKPEAKKPPAPGGSEHQHPGLGAEHLLLIGSQDQGLLAGQVVRLGADVPTGFKEAWRLGDRGTEPLEAGQRHQADAPR